MVLGRFPRAGTPKGSDDMGNTLDSSPARIGDRCSDQLVPPAELQARRPYPP
jgi:hypothetical protein